MGTSLRSPLRRDAELRTSVRKYFEVPLRRRDPVTGWSCPGFLNWTESNWNSLYLLWIFHINCWCFAYMASKSAMSQFALFVKWVLLKLLLLLHFPILSPEIFRMPVKVHFALEIGADFWFRPLKKFGDQILKNVRRKLSAKFFWGLNQKSASI